MHQSNQFNFAHSTTEQVSREAKRHTKYSTHESWSIVPRNGVYQCKFPCVFDQITNDKGNNDDGNDAEKDAILSSND